MITFIGYVAAIIDVGQFAPQLWRVIRRRDDHRAMSGISLIAYAIATSQAILWTIYGFATNRLPIGLPNVFIAPACAYILILALRSRFRRAPQSS
ncbi:MAG: PQ-loop domain-containing transporter [Acidimicrobiales bacterium]